jgi:hypothetical protein
MQDDESPARRDQFLLAMYGEMWGNINRHILVIWQSVTALLGAFAALALIQKGVISLDFACGLLVLICAWVVAHVIDANYWFARNQLIITNIERQFLNANDEKLIHPYFLEHRQRVTLDHLSIQCALAAGVFLLIIGWHFCARVLPILRTPWTGSDWSRSLPYVVSVLSAGGLFWLRHKHKDSYAQLLARSPGLTVAQSRAASA